MRLIKKKVGMLYWVLPTIELWFSRIIFIQIYGLLVVTSRFRFENSNNWCYNKILDGEIIIVSDLYEI